MFDAPGTAEECKTKAEDYIDKRNNESFEQAIYMSSVGLAKDVGSLPCRFVRAFALEKLDRYADSIADWTACIEGGFRPAACSAKRGWAYHKTNAFEKAIEDYNRIMDGDLASQREQERINRFNIALSRGMALCEAGLYEAAEHDLNSVARHSSPGGQVTYWLLVCRYRGDKDRASRETLNM